MTVVERGFSKVPEVTLVFWIIKIAATTLGETAGDAVSMSMNLGYAVGSIIFVGIFVAAVAVQIGADVVVFADSGADNGSADDAVALVGRTLADISTANFV